MSPGRRRRSSACSATCSIRTWRICRRCRKGCAARRPVSCSSATIRKSASASSRRRWRNILPAKRIRCVLIAGGKYHDIDFARLELLKLLAEDERVRVRVFEDYTNVAAINEADFVVTYTCDVTPPLEAQEALRAFRVA